MKTLYLYMITLVAILLAGCQSEDQSAPTAPVTATVPPSVTGVPTATGIPTSTPIATPLPVAAAVEEGWELVWSDEIVPIRSN